MSDAAPDPEKNRRSRSFGSFLLVLVVLLIILVIVGDEPFNQPDELTQDQFEWHLNLGHIEEMSSLGTEKVTHRIEGWYQEGTDPRKRFKTSFSEVTPREEEFRDLKGRHLVPISSQELLTGLESGSYTLIDVRHLTAKEKREPLPQSGSDSSGRSDGASGAPVIVVAPPEYDRKERVLVSAITEDETFDFDVQLTGRTDLKSLLATLAQRSPSITHQRFDLSKDGGTTWKDSTSPLLSTLFFLGPWVLLFIIFMIFMRQMRSQGGAGGVMSFGRSRAQLYSKEKHTNTTFDDVAGAEEAKAEVREVVEFLKNPSRFTRIGGRIPRGVLLVGSPGCGKTLLAKAIAGEAEVPFFSISGSDFVEMFVGVGASRVRDLFKQARENSPCIIFLDEIDAVGRRRGSGMGGGHDEREQTLNAILVEMDGFGTDEGIIVVAATNRPDVLDPALLRPGRFDREVTIDLPDIDGRRAILGVHIKQVQVRDDIDLDSLARSTPGYSGADLAAIINEAAIMAVLAKRDEVEMEDLEEARDKVRFGRQKISRTMEEEDRRITAFHEAGHAVVAAAIEEIDSPHKVTIVPRGRALGSTMVIPERESYHMQKKKLLGQLAMLFGGRVSEAIFCGDISAGASDDIQRATDLARAMVTELGMSEKIGPISYAERQGSDFLGTELMRSKLHSEETAREIDNVVGEILSSAYERAESVLLERKDEVTMVAEALLALETVSGSEIERLLAGCSIADLRPPEEPKAENPATEPEPAAREETDMLPDPGHGELPGSPGLSPA